MCNPRMLKLGNLSRSKVRIIYSLARVCSSVSLVGRHAEIATGSKPVLTSPRPIATLNPLFPHFV